MSRTHPERPDSQPIDLSLAADALLREEPEEEEDEEQDDDEDDKDKDEDGNDRNDENDGYSE